MCCQLTRTCEKIRYVKGLSNLLKFKLQIFALSGFKAIRDDVSLKCRQLVEQSIQFRKQNNVSRPDFLQLVMEMEKEGSITMEQLVSSANN